MDEPAAARGVRAPTWILALAALAVLAGALSAWGTGFAQDDWRLLARARQGSWVLPEPNHLSLPLGLLWWLGDRTGSPLPARAAALACHLLSHLVLVPRLCRALLPGLPPRVGLEAGLLGLSAWVALDPLVWACTAAYALALPCLLGAGLLHLRGLEAAGSGAASAQERRSAAAARAGSLLLVGLGLLTWELAVVGPPLLLLLGWARGGGLRASARAALPAGALLLGYAGLKLALGSTEVLAGRGPLRLLLNLGAAPLLLASPLPWPRAALVSAAGAIAAALAGGLLLGALLRARRREPAALLSCALLPLLPVLPGPGPESRYLYLAVPFAAAGLRLALHLAPPVRARPALLGLLALWGALSAGSASAWAARWRRADREGQAALERVVAAAARAGVSRLVLVDLPDRLPGWGPCWKHPVWRLGAEEALAGRGLQVVARVHSVPPDPETQGLVPATPPLDADSQAAWAREGLLVLRWPPAGSGDPASGDSLVPGGGE